MMRKIIFAIAMYGLVATCQGAGNMSFHGTLVEPPCKINNDQMVDVDFGNAVVTTDVAAGLARKSIEYTIDCGVAIPGETLLLSIEGSGSDFDSDFLRTSISGLGIKIEENGSLLPVNSQLALASSTEHPDLVAVLVQDENTHLPTGEFSAIAALKVVYQ